MKLFVILSLALYFSPASAQYSFTILGSTTDALNNKKVYLAITDGYSEHKYVERDTTVVRNNKFIFKGTLRKPSENASLVTKDPTGYVSFVLDSGHNEIKFYKLPAKTPFYKNILSNNEVQNSESSEIKKQIDSLTNYYYLKKGRPSPTNKNDLVLNAENRLELLNKELAVFRKYPNAYYSLIYLYSLSNRKTSLPTQVLLDSYQSLNESIRTSELGLEFYQSVKFKKGSEIGNQAYEFTAMTNKDSLFTNTTLTGKPYLIAFGATWCVPCKERLPILKQLYSKYHSKGLEIVYVNLDEKTEKWKSDIAKDNLEWINVSEGVKMSESKISKLFHVIELPSYFIVGTKGEIIYNSFQLKDDELKELEKYTLRSLQ